MIIDRIDPSGLAPIPGASNVDAAKEPHRGCSSAFDRGTMAACCEFCCLREVRPVTDVRGFACKTNREMRFSESGRPDQQDVRRVMQIRTRPEFVDQLTVNAGLRVVIEVFERGW